MAVARGGALAWWRWRIAISVPSLIACSGGGTWCLQFSQRVTTVHTLSGGSCSFVGGAKGASGSQRVHKQLIRTSKSAALALVILGFGRCLGVLWPYSLAIVGVVCTVFVMANKGQPGARNSGLVSRLGGYAMGVSRTVAE